MIYFYEFDMRLLLVIFISLFLYRDALGVQMVFP